MCKNIQRTILRFMSRIFNYRFILAYKAFKNRILTEGIKRELKSCGKDFWVESPIETRGLRYISIGQNFSCRSGLRLEAIDSYNGESFCPHIEIGDNVRINNYCHIGIVDNLLIEDNVVVASKVYISDHSHGSVERGELNIPVKDRTLFSKGCVHIEKNVWIGENVSILPGVTIGRNSVIGANSVVTKCIPENCVAVGAPATVIKRFS